MSSPQTRLAALALGALMLIAAPALAQGGHDHSHDHDHDHSHETADPRIAQGYFLDSQIAPRALSDWEGEWRSVYPLLMAGGLAPVIEKKAESGAKTAEEYRAYYETGYKTDVDRITIKGKHVTFHRDSGDVSGDYAADDLEILTYDKGNRGVRYIFRKTAGDAAAPGVIQFSDHIIAPQKSHHFHLYWGDDRAEVLKELTNWPTYFPAALTDAQVVDEMLAH